jgi:uncharacterized protein (TIGR00269 family)
MQEKIEKIVEKTIKDFGLFTRKHKVAVAASGGKDSTTLLFILKKLGYNITAITVDSVIGNYTKENLENLRGYCKKLDILLKEISFKQEFGYSLCYIKSILHSKGYKLNSCTICGVLRRYLINKYAKKWDFDRVATGHNMDDEAQATLMNIFRSDIDRFKRQGPKVGISDSGHFIPRVKPLYFVSEKEIVSYSKKHKFPVVYSRCPCSKEAYRNTMRDFLAVIEKIDGKSIENIVKFTARQVKNMKNEKNIEIPMCEMCGEASNERICKTCQILNVLKGDTNASLS